MYESPKQQIDAIHRVIADLEQDLAATKDPAIQEALRIAALVRLRRISGATAEPAEEEATAGAFDSGSES